MSSQFRLRWKPDQHAYLHQVPALDPLTGLFCCVTPHIVIKGGDVPGPSHLRCSRVDAVDVSGCAELQPRSLGRERTSRSIRYCSSSNEPA